MIFTLPKLINRPSEWSTRLVVKFAWLPCRYPHFFDGPSFIWLEKYYAHQVYTRGLGWWTQYRSRIEQ